MGLLLITLLVFSGRRNPVCHLDSQDPNYQKISALLPAPPGGVIIGGLGYQGFVVQHGIHGSYINIPKGYDANLERLLLTSCNFSESLKNLILQHDLP